MTTITPTLLAFVLILAGIACAGVLLARQLARRQALRDYERATSTVLEKEPTR